MLFRVSAEFLALTGGAQEDGARVYYPDEPTVSVRNRIHVE